MPIAPSLAALAEHQRFILWRKEWSAKLNKMTKVPVSPYTGRRHDNTDASHHVSYDEASKLVKAHKCDGVAFVVTAAEKFFFLDIDNARTGSVWGPIVAELAAMLPGAAIEVSQSGDGLHFFGRYSGPEPVHACRNKALGLELYTSGRFVALTENNAQGDASIDLTQQLYAVIDKHFVGDDSIASEVGAEIWKDEASPEWHGPTDDTALLNIMLTAKLSMNQVLNGKATFAQLWNADATALGMSYPDVEKNPPAPWGYSEADMALASYLAFYTGRNTERIRRLMFQSSLRRAKWVEHRTYLWRTISRACSFCNEVYRGKEAVIPAQLPPGASTTPIEIPTPQSQVEQTAGMQWLSAEHQAEYFNGCVYVRDLHKIFVPDGGLLKPDVFAAMYAGYSFSMDARNEKTTRSPWEAFIQSQAIRHPRTEAVCFRPERPPGEIIREEGQRLLNIYVPIITPRVQGDISPFINHMRKLFPDERDFSIILNYIAAMVQYPGTKFQWCPLIQGAEGNGKTILTRCISYAVGSRYTHLPNAKSLAESGSKFNSWIQCKLFVGIEEISFRERADIFDVLKPIITNDRIGMEGKGVDQYTGDNRANFLANCNGKEDIAVGIDKRRYGVFYTPQQNRDDIEAWGMGGNYFRDLWGWLRSDGYAIVNDFLRTLVIADEFNPAGQLNRAPDTSSTREMIELSQTPIEQEIREAISEGRQGFSGGWISSLALERLLERFNKNRAIPPQRRRRMLQEMGYDWHPNLPDGRVSNFMPSENGRPRLYVHADNVARYLHGVVPITEAYMRAQHPLGDASASVVPFGRQTA